MPPTTPHDPLKDTLARYQSRVEAVLERVLPRAQAHPTRLHEAMRYAVLGGGKRVRPVLVYATGEALGIALDTLDIPAAAVELIHAYSLVHDDLPAMDDDDLRRGKPTCHKAYDEATAILVGDGLQALAFQILAHDDNVLTPTVRLRMIDQLGSAAGSRGMVGGQAIDLAAVGKDLNVVQLEDMHIHKTGALIRASVLLGAYATPTITARQLESLDHYAKCIGLAFQIRDDILDIEGSTQELGKTQGADLAKNKPTYPTIIGLDASKERAGLLHDDALRALGEFDSRADTLRALSAYIVDRRQ
jgi:geranylgeranyl pyrophosphate synthase